MKNKIWSLQLFIRLDLIELGDHANMISFLRLTLCYCGYLLILLTWDLASQQFLRRSSFCTLKAVLSGITLHSCKMWIYRLFHAEHPPTSLTTFPTSLLLTLTCCCKHRFFATSLIFAILHSIIGFYFKKSVFPWRSCFSMKKMLSSQSDFY